MNITGRSTSCQPHLPLFLPEPTPGGPVPHQCLPPATMSPVPHPGVKAQSCWALMPALYLSADHVPRTPSLAFWMLEFLGFPRISLAAPSGTLLLNPALPLGHCHPRTQFFICTDSLGSSFGPMAVNMTCLLMVPYSMFPAPTSPPSFQTQTPPCGF